MKLQRRCRTLSMQVMDVTFIIQFTLAANSGHVMNSGHHCERARARARARARERKRESERVRE